MSACGGLHDEPHKQPVVVYYGTHALQPTRWWLVAGVDPIGRRLQREKATCTVCENEWLGAIAG
jgi:hypothetical protein